MPKEGTSKATNMHMVTYIRTNTHICAHIPIDALLFFVFLGSLAKSLRKLHSTSVSTRNYAKLSVEYYNYYSCELIIIENGEHKA